MEIIKVTIPEDNLVVVLCGSGKGDFYIVDNRNHLDDLTIAWQWNGHEFSDGRFIGVWLKFIPYLEECNGSLSDFGIPYSDELEIHGNWAEYYLKSRTTKH